MTQDGKKRANIIADIVGHPKGAPSVEELDYKNPSLSEDAIRRHLSTPSAGGRRSRTTRHVTFSMHCYTGSLQLPVCVSGATLLPQANPPGGHVRDPVPQPPRANSRDGGEECVGTVRGGAPPAWPIQMAMRTLETPPTGIHSMYRAQFPLRWGASSDEIGGYSTG